MQREAMAALVTRSCGLSIRASSTDMDLLAEAVPWLPEGWLADDAVTEPDRHYHLRVEEPPHTPGLLEYVIDVDGAEHRRHADFGIFCDLLENDLHHYIATYTRGPNFVHAGVAVWSGKAIVIPGRSFAGKSTLTEALLQAGATYYSDDYAPIDEAGLVHPFPRHLRLRNRGDRLTQNRVDPAGEGWPIGDIAVPVGIVAALRFDREQGWSVEQTSRGAGVLALLKNTVAARERPVDSMAVMARAVEQAIVLEGTRGEAAEAAERLLALLN
ncbi:MAG: hypothetical protein KF883_10150 [Thermomicrobiales bacterium]|nr:hypothetical protein [Thermomicrobiales bacterium]